MVEVETAIMTLFNNAPGGTHNTFYTAIGGRLYLDEAPQGAIFPYCTMHIIAGSYDWQFKETFEDTLIQFSLFDFSPSAVTVENAFTNLKDLFDWCTLSVSGYGFLYMRRGRTSLTRESKIWHRSCDYNCVVEKV